MIKAEVIGLDLTMKNLQRLEQEAGISMRKMIKGVTIQAGKSAARLSRPDPGKKPDKMVMKYRKRKIVKTGGAGANIGPKGRQSKLIAGSAFTYVKPNNQMFTVVKKITPKKARARGLKLVTKTMQYWSKKENHWKFAPINPRTGKPNTKMFRTGLMIPGAGAVKTGWVHALRAAGDRTLSGTQGIRGNRLGTGLLSSFRGVLFNRVRYASKIAGSVPREAEQKAWRWLLANLWRTEKKRLTSIKL